MHLLLMKQDEISILEEKLDLLDSKEDRPLFLGSIRRDINSDRLQVIQSLKTALSKPHRARRYRHKSERVNCRRLCILTGPLGWPGKSEHDPLLRAHLAKLDVS